MTIEIAPLSMLLEITFCTTKTAIKIYITQAEITLDLG
jgi:hypothetical protein